MPRGKKELAEQIIPKLREVEVEVGRGKTVLEAVKKIGVTEQTYYRWKKKFGGLRIDQAKRRRAVEHVRDALGRCRSTTAAGTFVCYRWVRGSISGKGDAPSRLFIATATRNDSTVAIF